jgi:hypothetical protein
MADGVCNLKVGQLGTCERCGYVRHLRDDGRPRVSHPYTRCAVPSDGLKARNYDRAADLAAWQRLGQAHLRERV